MATLTREEMQEMANKYAVEEINAHIARKERANIVFDDGVTWHVSPYGVSLFGGCNNAFIYDDEGGMMLYYNNHVLTARGKYGHVDKTHPTVRRIYYSGNEE